VIGLLDNQDREINLV